jgi:hypothetical protein
MSHSQTWQAFTAAALMSLAAVVSGCGNSSTVRDSSSSGPGRAGSTSGVSECARFDSSNTRLQGQITTYYLNGQFREDLLRLRIGDVVESFNSATGAIKFFRWKADLSGTVTLDPTPLSFQIEKGTTSTTPIGDIMSELNTGTINLLRNNHSIPGSSPRDFFANSVVVLRGLDIEWDAIKVVVYQGSSVIGDADVLAPVFHANPSRYASDHASVLNQLHPFWSDRSQSLSDSQWSQRASGLCF